MRERKTQWLLMLVAVLLTINLIVTVADWLLDPAPAEANLVSGKNWFTTASPDGEIIFLWQYWTSSEVGPNAKGTVKYYGRIKAGGHFVEP